MARRRYLSTDISTDTRVNKLAMQAGDFAALLYTWMIPHATDAGVLPADPEALLFIVCPGRRDKEPADITIALKAMVDLDLLLWDQQAGTVQFPPSFHKHQSYITEKRRALAQAQAPSAPCAGISANQRTSPQDSADERVLAQNSTSSSLSSSLSSSFTENAPNGVNGADAPPTVDPPADPPNEPPAPPPKPRTPKQQASDALHERRTELYAAYCRGVGIQPDSLPWRQGESRAFGELKEVLKEPQLTTDVMDRLSRYAAAAYRWRSGKRTPSVAECLAAFAEWDSLGQPNEPPPTKVGDRPKTAADWNKGGTGKLVTAG